MKSDHRTLSISFLVIQILLLVLIWGILKPPKVNQAFADKPSELPTPTEESVDMPPFTTGEYWAGLTRPALLHTELIDPSPFQVKKYTIQKGDTAWAIAKKFGLKIESVLWGNEGMSADAGLLRIGQKINILPVNGVLHTVKAGDTLERIEKKHRVSAREIVECVGNDFPLEPPYTLVEGEQIIVPNGTNPVAWDEPGPVVETGKGRKSAGFYSGPLVTMGTGTFVWPVSPVYITQIFWSGHHAIDVGAYVGEPVFASDSGTVIFARWDKTGYGNLVIIDHGNGYWTYYGHNSAFLVKEGQGVLQGQQIAQAGSTGNSTGPHVDFRIRVNAGAFVDPAGFLP